MSGRVHVVGSANTDRTIAVARFPGRGETVPGELCDEREEEQAECHERTLPNEPATMNAPESDRRRHGLRHEL